jgi:S1-C subfamily serine protease
VGLAYPNIFTIRGSFFSVPAEIVEEDPRHDIALVRSIKNPFSSGEPSGPVPDRGGTQVNALYGLAPLSVEPVRDGEAVAVSGYPLSESSLITTSGAIATAWGFETEQTPIDRGGVRYLPDPADVYYADVAVNPGNSGGPAYRIEDGTVIGVTVAYRMAPLATLPPPFFANSGLAIVVPIKYGQALIERNV